MPEYNYMGVTRDGRYLRGVITAENRKEVNRELMGRGLWMIWYKEKAPPPPIPDPAAPESISEKIDTARESASGLLGWVMDHSGRAILTRKQAQLVVLAMVALLFGTILNAYINLSPRRPPHHAPVPIDLHHPKRA